MKRLLLRFIPLFGVFALALASRWIVDWNAVAERIGQTRLGDLAAATSWLTIIPFLAAAKLRRLLGALGLARTTRQCLSAVMASLAVNSLVPLRLGDLVRAAFLCSARSQFPAMAGVVVAERFIDFSILLLLSAQVRGTWMLWPALVVAVAWLGIGLLSRLDTPRVPFRRLIDELRGAVRALLASPRRLVAVLGLTAAQWLAACAVLVLCLRATGFDLPLSEFVLAVPAALLAGALPVTVSGLGTRDAVLLVVLGHSDKADAIVAGSLLYAMLMHGFLPLAGVLLLGKRLYEMARSAIRTATEDEQLPEVRLDENAASLDRR